MILDLHYLICSVMGGDQSQVLDFIFTGNNVSLISKWVISAYIQRSWLPQSPLQSTVIIIPILLCLLQSDMFHLGSFGAVCLGSR